MDESTVHSRIYALFPLLLVQGWKYTGFQMQRGKRDAMTILLDFKKMVAGKLGGCAIQVAASDFHRDSFNLREHIKTELAKAETRLTNLRLMEMEGAA